MLRHIESLRTKPLHVRNAYAFGFSFLITLCIASVWAVTTINRFSPNEHEIVSQVETTSSLSRSFTQLKESIGDMVTSMRATVVYTQKEEPSKPVSNTLNLEELYASSTKARMEKQLTTPLRATTSPATKPIVAP